jgi:cytochrome c biogenesis protein CcmG, thiol:disulfide interchange protein DsbE
MRRIWLWTPLGLFMLFFAVVASGLMKPSTHVVTSKLIGKPLPKFSLPPAHMPQPGLGSATFKQGQPRLLNIFASWCIPCQAEAPILLQLARRGVQIDGIAVRDRPQDLNRFLARGGNPFVRIGSDMDGVVQLSLGSSGVPETFVIDGNGIIRHQHIGDIRIEDVPEMLAQIRAAQ